MEDAEIREGEERALVDLHYGAAKELFDEAKGRAAGGDKPDIFIRQEEGADEGQFGKQLTLVLFEAAFVDVLVVRETDGGIDGEGIDVLGLLYGIGMFYLFVHCLFSTIGFSMYNIGCEGPELLGKTGSAIGAYSGTFCGNWGLLRARREGIRLGESLREASD